METVFSRGPRRHHTPEEAVQDLLRAAVELAALGTGHPIDYWTSKAKD